MSNKTIYEKMSEELTQSFKHKALLAGWKPTLLENISVVVNEGGLSFDYPDAMAQEIEDFEYGTPSSSPNAVIRPFMADNKDILDEPLESEALTSLVMMGAL